MVKTSSNGTKSATKSVPKTRKASPVVKAAAADTLSTEDSQILSALNLKDPTYYASLLQRYLSGGQLTGAELAELKSSSLLDHVSENIDKLKPKKATEEEVRQLQIAELTLVDLQRKIGQLEIDKSFLLDQAHIMEQKKAEFLKEMGINHGIPRNTNWIVDLDTGEIKIKSNS